MEKPTQKTINNVAGAVQALSDAHELAIESLGEAHKITQQIRACAEQAGQLYLDICQEAGI